MAFKDDKFKGQNRVGEKMFPKGNCPKYLERVPRK